MTPELIYLSYEEHLRDCGSKTLETRRLREYHADVFKTLNGYEHVDIIMFYLTQER